MVLKKVSKDSNMRWIDPETDEVTCTWNDCYEKFDQKSDTMEYTFDYHNDTAEITFYYHACRECNRRLQSKTDLSRSKDNYREHKSVPTSWTEHHKIAKLQSDKVRSK
jgi:hypothetical protein